MFNYLKNRELKVQNFIDSTKNFLYEKFGIKDKTFSYSNPLGQVILVTKNISRLVFFYIKDASNQTSFNSANRRHTVHGLAQLQGHDAFRGSASRLMLNFVMKNEFDVSTIKGSYIFIPNYIRIKCIENDLIYSVNMGKDYDKILIQNISNISFGVVQGQFKQREFPSDGRNLQTYSLTISPSEMIDHDLVRVEVNGVPFTKYSSMNNSLFMDKFVMVKTGITSGIDIIFGKDSSHTIPRRGETITVTYLMHNGKSGNVENPQFKFIDSAYDELGNEINLNELYRIFAPEGQSYLGADPEDIELTRIIAPNVVPNSIIHDKKSLIYHLNMLNLFSNVKVVKKNQTYTAILYPKIKDKIVGKDDYFTIDTSKFLITTLEKIKILEKLNSNQSANIEVNIGNPKLTNFGINIVIEAFSNGEKTESEISREVRKFLNDYMISLKRLNKIPSSDITKGIDSMKEVDTVRVEFISQNLSHIDELGNILIPDDEIAVLRGNFYDNNGNYVEDSFDEESRYSFVNIDIRWI